MQSSTDSEEELFGGPASPAARALIARAKSAGASEAVALLRQARAEQPACLPVYYLLYKLHARRQELAAAEEVARAGLAQAAIQAGLPEDIQRVQAAQLAVATHSADSPGRFWLFTLKALAFIRLRQQQRDEARTLLALIARLDPEHSTGSAVTEALLLGSEP